MSLEVGTCSLCFSASTVAATCSCCGRYTKHHGDVHSVSEWLRNNGWVTKPGAIPFSSMVWVCPFCAKPGHSHSEDPSGSTAT